MKLQTFFICTMMVCMTLPATAQQDTAKQYQKIEQLFSVMNMEARCQHAASTSAAQTIKDTPKLVGKEKEVQAFFTKYAGYAACKNSLIKLFAKYYTTEELDDLISLYKTSDLTAFNKTPTGKKEAVTSSKIEVETITIMTQNVQAHVDELNKLAN